SSYLRGPPPGPMVSRGGRPQCPATGLGHLPGASECHRYPALPPADRRPISRLERPIRSGLRPHHLQEDNLMRPTNFSMHLTAFLTNYLPAQRTVSPNTIKAYRDAFVLLLRYCRDVRRLAPDRLNLDQIDPPLMLDFLDHLEKERRCAARTRNLRLTAVHAFFRYVQTEEPGLLLRCQRILAIPLQRCAPPPVEYLSPESLAAILRQPDLARRAGRRDAVLLSLLYDTGARVQELIDLSVRDVRLDSPAQVRLMGKGRKTRVVPLMNSTVDLLRAYP